MSRSSTVEHTTDNRVMEVRFFPRQPCQQGKCPTDSHKVGLVGALPTAGTSLGRWRSGPTHRSAKPENRGFESHSSLHFSERYIMSDQIISEELMQYITRIETINAEIDEKKIDRKEVYSELKSVGYVPKTVRQIIRLRKLEAHVRLEEEALLDTYKNAVGL